MELVTHLFGVCTDTHTHFDLMDLMFAGGGVTTSIVYLKFYFKTCLGLFKDFLNKLSKPNDNRRTYN